MVGSSGLNRVTVSLLGLWKVVRVHERLPTNALEILEAPAAVIQQAPADMGRFTVGTRRPDEARHRVDDLTELVFALPNGFLRPSSIVDIDQDAVPTQHRAIAGSQRFSADLEPPISTVRSSKSANRVVGISGFEILEPGRNLECDVVGVDFLHPSPTYDFVRRRSKIFEHALVDVINIA